MKKYFSYIQSRVDAIANLLLIYIAFLLPIITYRTKVLFTILFLLLFFKKNVMSSIMITLKNPIVISYLLFFLLHMFFAFIIGNSFSNIYLPKFSLIFLYPILIVLFLEYKYYKTIISAFLFGLFVSEIVSYDIYFNINLLSFIPYIIHNATSSYPTAFMTHLNYGLFLAISAGIIFQSFFMHKTYLFILNILLFASITATQFINIGRSGYILYIISILLILIFQYKQLIVKKIHIFIALIALILYIAYNLSPNFKSRIDLTLHTFEQIYNYSNYNNSIGIRIQNYKYSFDLITEKPLLGYGIGQNVQALSDSMKTGEANISKVISRNSTTDSQYLDILLQFGLIGFIIFINIFFQIMRYQYQEEYQKRLSILFVILFLIYGIQANFMHFYNVTSLLLIFFSSILASKKSTTQHTTISLKDRRTFIDIVILFILYILAKQL